MSHSRLPITLIPYSQIQHYDIELDLTGRGKSFSYINDNTDTLRILSIDGDSGLYLLENNEPLPERQQESIYSVNLQKVCDIFAGQWLPLPYFKCRYSNSSQAPLNWVRLYIGHGLPDAKTRKIVIAFDTELQDAATEAENQFAPDYNDVTSSEFFALPNSINSIVEFANLPWVNGWIYSLFDKTEAAERLRRREKASVAMLRNYALSCYITLVRSLSADDSCPTVAFIDTLSSNELSSTISVDFVLDVGNSRSCGMLVEHNGGIDLNNSYPLRIRSLSTPTEIYKRPFPSRIEFSRPNFGLNFYSRKSGRTAFIWPSAARVGWEAEHLASLNAGGEGRSGMSSPKRYLWSTERESQEWYFNQAMRSYISDGLEESLTNGDYFKYFEDDGRYLPPPENGQDTRISAVTANFCKSSLMTFFLRELFLQAMTLINNPQNRARNKSERLPRQLGKIVLTMPTAMPKPERDLLYKRVTDAIDSLWEVLGKHTPPKPDIKMQWDEATATQAVFLYNEIVCNFLGDIRNFFAASTRNGYRALLEASNSHPPAPPKTLRIASIDIGGGTSDLIITSYENRDNGLFPKQEFREGFNIAGDDILYDVIEQHVLPAFEAHIKAAGVEHPRHLMSKLFGSNFGDQKQEERTLRQQICVQMLLPFGYALLRAHEELGVFSPRSKETIAWQQVFDQHSQPHPRIIDYISSSAAAYGAQDFDLSAFSVSVDHATLYQTIKNTMSRALACFSEVLFEYNCDYVLMAGRPSRLPAIQDLITAKWPVSPDRLIFMSSYKVGTWHPYRQIDGTIGDPKTCAAVGAMICTYSVGSLTNFYLKSTDLTMRSTARYIGPISNERIYRDRTFFHDIDLDNIRTIGDAVMEFSAPVAIGFRQLDLERWPATRLYRMEYPDPDRYGAGAPYFVNIATKDPDRDPNFEIFEIAEISKADREHTPMPRTCIRLKLQTLNDSQGFWQDTGSFNV